MMSSSETMMRPLESAGRHALVIGGSLAGLFAARVLADFFDRVTIVDRDSFPLTPEHRKGVPLPAEWQSLIVNGRPPHKHAGLLLSVDRGRWHVTLGGMAGNAPPTDEAGFLRWAHDLPDPSIYEAVRIAQPLTPIRGFGTPENHLRHFERLQRWPSGFCCLTGNLVLTQVC